MNTIIIGSTAANHWFPDWRKAKDLDILSTGSMKVSGVDAQHHELAQMVIDQSSDKEFADPSVLYTLKVSHAYWDIHWDKTMYDIWQFQLRGCGIIKQDLHDSLVKMWTKVHGAKKVNLTQSKDKFWNDAVERRFDHEWLHDQVKFFDRPMHETLHPEHSKVLIDRRKFFGLSETDRLKAAMEEILTIAIERADLGSESKNGDRLRAVKYSHKKLCTTMSKGWFAQYLVENACFLVGDRWWSGHLDKVLNNLPKEKL